MKVKDILIKINDIKHKLNKDGHPFKRVLVTDENGEVITSINISSDDLDKLEGIEDNIQAQINKKLNKEGFTPDKILIIDGNGAITESDLSSEKLNHLANVNDDIQEQIDEVNKSIESMDMDIENVKDSIEQSVEGLTNKIDSTEENINASFEETTRTITDRVDELQRKYDEIVFEGGADGVEVAEARKPFSTLKERLDDIEEKTKSNGDISIGVVEDEDRTLTVYNSNGEIVGTINKDGASFEKMNITELSCGNTILTQKPVTIYVDANNGNDSNTGSSAAPLRTITEAISRLNKYLLGNCYIKVQAGEYNECLNIQGFCGNSSLYIDFADNVVINGNIEVNFCSAGIRINGFSTTNKTVLNHTSSSNDVVSIFGCQYVFLTYFTVNGNSATKYNFNCNQGSGVAIKHCSINNSTTSAIVAFECSRVYVVNCTGTGHAQYSVYSASGSTTCLSGTIPNAPKENWNTTGILHGTAIKTE